MGGSQLKQLKAAINTSGLQDSRGKKRKRGGYQNGNAPGSGSILEHRDKRAQKLDEIQKKFNTFDIKVEKLKNDVGGRKLKGTMGRPGVSKQVAIERVRYTSLECYGLFFLSLI
jgi:nucleolar protein 14